MTLPLFRCRADGSLLRRSDIAKGKCLGHSVVMASECSFIEYLKVKWWMITGSL